MPLRLIVAYIMIAVLAAGAIAGSLYLTRHRRAAARWRRQRARERKR
jgi:hypothetical protein